MLCNRDTLIASKTGTGLLMTLLEETCCWIVNDSVGGDLLLYSCEVFHRLCSHSNEHAILNS